MPENAYPAWKQARCGHCKAGLPLDTRAGWHLRFSGKFGNYHAECSAPTEAEYIAELERELAKAKEQVQQLTPMAEFGQQCYQDRCENAYVEQSVMRRELAEAKSVAAAFAAKDLDSSAVAREKLASVEGELAEARRDTARLLESLKAAKWRIAELDRILADALRDRAQLLRALERARAVIVAFLDDKMTDLTMIDEMERVREICKAAIDASVMGDKA